MYLSETMIVGCARFSSNCAGERGSFTGGKCLLLIQSFRLTGCSKRYGLRRFCKVTGPRKKCSYILLMPCFKCDD